MLYWVLKAWEFLDKKLLFLVEQATKNNNNPTGIEYLNELIFNGKRFYH
ncbi:hypothetical protein HJ01_00687 [Flavobacterium frigoris PS1]|uniref:Uncharacterized protein n=1 Tax=Flavobacterium frigoris (strain PS1) TaxID=1086011 RepID=H7FNL6_FLAFP|nr:hypothetical protein HJ01_00687 [Flavobacterium frigoris PS1]